MLGAACVAAPVGFALIPSAHVDSPVYQEVGLWVIAWQAMLLVGGLAILVGWWTRQLEREAFGYILAAVGSLEYVAALVLIRGWRAWVAGVLVVGFAGGMLGRAHAAYTGRRA